MQLKLTAEMMEKVIKHTPVVALVMRDILKSNQFPTHQLEHFWLVGLNHHNNISFVELVAVGEHEQVKMTSTDVFRIAIMKNAPKLIFVHNHPNGNVKPSPADKITTLCLIRLAEMAGIEVVDHIIMSEDDYFSFAEDGLLDEIRLSDEYRLLDPAKYDQLKSVLKQAGKVEAIFEDRISITKKMDEFGIDKELIIKITGFDPELV